MTGVAGLQTFKHGLGSLTAITAVTVNGSAATFTEANGVVTLSSPTLVGGEAIVVTETQAPPSLPVTVPQVANPSVNVPFTRTQNGASTTQTYDVVDQTGVNPAYAVTGTTRTNH